MTARHSKVFIGAFVLGGIGLVIVGIVLFGTGRLFTRPEQYILYFDESVTGLSTGAPVEFRGVRVGTVVEILLEGDLEKFEFLVPIIAEIEPDRFNIKAPFADKQEYHQALIDKGLRAQLRLQSLLTGQLMIHLDFYPDRPSHHVPGSTLKQIPTIASPPAALVQKLQELPLEELVMHASNALAGLSRLVNTPELVALPERLSVAVDNAGRLIRRIEGQVGMLSADAREAINAATETLRQARTSLNYLDAAIQSIHESAADERTYYQLQETLRNVSQAAESLRWLADYLNRHPEALLRGRANPDGESQ
jgi:paraquat-inducible protein B